MASKGKPLYTGPKHIDGIPDYGWRVRTDHKFSEKAKPFQIPRLHQIPPLIGMSWRYAQCWWKHRSRDKRMFIDNLDLVPLRAIYGVPVGGIGCGTIGRGYKGEFCRFALIPGMYTYHTVEADQFTVCIRKNGQTIYQQVLSPYRPKGKALNSWNWAYNAEFATYHGLYPRSWTVYDLPGQNVRLICRQISPVFPHDYKDTSIPTAVFVWSVENKTESKLDISIMFTFKNGQGNKMDRQGGCWNEPFQSTEGATKVSGVMIHQKFRDMKCTYAVAAKHSAGVNVSHCVSFNPNTPAKELWRDLMEDGQLDSTEENSKVTVKGEEIATAVCAQCTVEPHQTSQVEFSLTWDMPVIHFGAQERLYCRRYSRFFGTEGNASPSLASYSLNTFPEWEEKIEAWQNPYLQNSKYPDWYKSALFNELYFVSDGGTVWADLMEDKNGYHSEHEKDLPEIIKEYGRFAWLEGHEYRMYNTYDVHHYASFALLMLWPKLQLSLQYDIADAIGHENSDMVKYVMDGNMDVQKAKSSVPHDIGDPDDEPWKRLNAYMIHPTHEWKDLNTKFILQVYRDYIGTKDEKFLKDMYPLAKAVTNFSLRWDTDDDGIIDNGGFADQTYDAWVMHGASSYCGGMWLAALKMMVEMAKLLDFKEDEEKYTQILEKGKKSFEKKLWNGKYYNYDSSTAVHKDSIMADQLAGHWYLKASGIADDSVFPKDHVMTALRTIYEHNVLPFRNGTMGAINGMRPNGKHDMTSIQSEEFWTGVIYSLGATMMQEGMMEEGWQTAYGTYHVCYEWLGLAFQTPEAYTHGKCFRSLGYMRPLAVWAIQWALDKFHPDLK